MSTLASRVLASLRRSGLSHDDRLIVGLSGGADSLALTHLLRDLYGHGSGPLPLAVHVDHGLRAESSDEARRVAALAAQLGVACEVVSVDVALWQQAKRQGLEAAARAARYAALAGAADRHGVDCIAVAHSQDDQAETILLRLARGASLRGLAGMREHSSRDIALTPERSRVVRCRLLRPFLRVARSEIHRYGAEHGLTPIEDESNRGVRFRRNAFRHELLPLVERLSPGATGVIARTAGILVDDADLLDALAEEALEQTVSLADDAALFDRAAFLELPPSLQRRVLASILVHLSPESAPLSHERLEALREATWGPVSRTIELGRGLVARIDYEIVAIGDRETAGRSLEAERQVPVLDAPIETPLAGSRTVALSDDCAVELQVPDGVPGWAMRSRRPGDRMRNPAGATVRLQDWLVNRKVPAALRDRLLLVTEQDVVRWVAGVSEDEFRDQESGVTAKIVRPKLEEADT